MDYIYLVGTEQVQTAGNTMRQAATDMQRAADSMSYSLEAHQRFLTNWLDDYRSIQNPSIN